MWFRSGQLRIRGLCFDPSGSWLLAVTADGRLYLFAALLMLDPNGKVGLCLERFHVMHIWVYLEAFFSFEFQNLSISASSDCSWPTDDLVCISEDLELEGRPSATCWWETLDNRKVAIIGASRF